MPPVILGVAFGNLLQGVPCHFDDTLVPYYTGSFWGLLNPFALLCGVVVSAMITLQGAVYLMHRTEGEIYARIRRAMLGAGIVLLVAFSAAGVWMQDIPGYAITSILDPAAQPNPPAKTVVREAGAWMANYREVPATLPAPAIAYLGVIGAVWLAWRGRTLAAFVASSLAIVGVNGTAGVSMFPFVMPSISAPDMSLTVWDAVSSRRTLTIMFWATLIFMPLIVLYTGRDYKVMAGKVTAAFWAMSAGYVSGVGFRPRRRVFGVLFSGGTCLAALALPGARRGLAVVGVGRCTSG